MKTTEYRITLDCCGTSGRFEAQFRGMPTGKEMAYAIASEPYMRDDRSEEIAVMRDIMKAVSRVEPGDIMAGGVKLGTFRVETVTVFNSEAGSLFEGVTDGELMGQGEAVELHNRYECLMLSYLMERVTDDPQIALMAIARVFGNLRTVPKGNVRAALFSAADRICRQPLRRAA